MSHEEIVRGYSDEALQGIIRQLSASGEWRQRREAAQAELKRRRNKLRR